MIHAFFDGACEPRNPGGNMGIGAFIVDIETGEIILEHAEYVPAHQTNSNNVAEYMALIRILECLIENKFNAGQRDIKIHGDSMLVIEQMSGNWRMKGGRYMKQAQRALTLMSQFARRPVFEWIPRVDNGIADRLSKQEMAKNNVQFKIQP